jgi:hypothetical protein
MLSLLSLGVKNQKRKNGALSQSAADGAWQPLILHFAGSLWGGNLDDFPDAGCHPPSEAAEIAIRRDAGGK